MFNKILLVFLFPLLLTLLNSFQAEKDLKLSIYVKDGKTKLSNVKAVLFESDLQMAKGKQLKTYSVNAGQVTINLELKKQFILELSKENYVSQQIYISTVARLEEIKSGTTDAADLDVDMFRDIDGLNTAPIQNKPTIKFRFIKDEGQFDTDKNYEDKMEPVLSNMKKQLAKILQDKFYKVCQDGYQFNEKKQYDEALLCYMQALEYYPGDKPVLKKIDAIEKNMTKEQAFQKFKKDGDDAVAQNNIDNALKSYKKALKLKPADSYVYSQIEKCKNGSLLAQNNKETKKKEEELTAQKNKQEENTSTNKKNTSEKSEEDVKKNEENKKINQDAKKEDLTEKNKETTLANNNIEKKTEENDKTENEENNNKSDVVEKKSNIADIKEDNRTQQEKIDSVLSEISKIESTGDKKAMSSAYNNLAELYFYNNDHQNALEYYEQSLKKNEELDDKMGTSVALMNLGVIYLNTYRLDEALKYFQRSLKIKQEIADKPGESKLLYRVGNVYYEQKDFVQAAEFFEKSLAIDKTLGNNEEIAATFNNLGVLYYEMRNYQKAIEYYNKAFEINEKAGHDKQMSIALNNMGNVNFDWNKYKDALDFYEKSLKIKEKIDYRKGIAVSLYNIGNVYKKLQNLAKATDYYNKSIKISKEENFNDLLFSIYIALSDLYNLQKDCQRSFETFKLASDYKPFAPVSKGRQFSEMQNKFEAESLRKTEEITMLKEEVARQKLYAQTIRIKKELELIEKNAEIERIESDMKFQRLQKYAFFIGFFLLLILAGVLYRGYKQKKKQKDEIEKKNQALEHAYFEISEKNEELNQQKEEITSQRDEIETQRDQILLQKQEITDSIYYAQYIQKALMRPEDGLYKLIPENFILFIPRNIVSGDFYWMGKKKDNLIVIAADCTGHGVPGAFMSMLGIALLNEIISRMPDPENNSTLSASNILDQLRDKVIESLHQTGKEGESKDGMDVALCVINQNQKRINFAGAFNPLYYVRNGELNEIKGDRMPIGIFINDKKPFTNHEINYEKGDSYYIFSDGFADQFGGPKGKKLSQPGFRKLILDSSNLTMNNQKEKLHQAFNNWKSVNGNEQEQIDDILVIGFHF